MLDDLSIIVIALLPFALGWFFLEYLPERRERRRTEFWRQQQLTDAREAARMLDGLPPHSRCLCSKCRAWREIPGNAEQLRLRGLR